MRANHALQRTAEWSRIVSAKNIANRCDSGILEMLRRHFKDIFRHCCHDANVALRSLQRQLLEHGHAGVVAQKDEVPMAHDNRCPHHACMSAKSKREEP